MTKCFHCRLPRASTIILSNRILWTFFCLQRRKVASVGFFDAVIFEKQNPHFVFLRLTPLTTDEQTERIRALILTLKWVDRFDHIRFFSSTHIRPFISTSSSPQPFGKTSGRRQMRDGARGQTWRAQSVTSASSIFRRPRKVRTAGASHGGSNSVARTS